MDPGNNRPESPGWGHLDSCASNPRNAQGSTAASMSGTSSAQQPWASGPSLQMSGEYRTEPATDSDSANAQQFSSTPESFGERRQHQPRPFNGVQQMTPQQRHQFLELQQLMQHRHRQLEHNVGSGIPAMGKGKEVDTDAEVTSDPEPCSVTDLKMPDQRQRVAQFEHIRRWRERTSQQAGEPKAEVPHSIALPTFPSGAPSTSVGPQLQDVDTKLPLPLPYRARICVPSSPIPSSHEAVTDYQKQISLLEEQNKKRLVMAGGSNHALQDYQMQRMLLEQQDKKRRMMAMQERMATDQQSPYSRAEYQAHLLELEQQSRRRLEMARAEQLACEKEDAFGHQLRREILGDHNGAGVREVTDTYAEIGVSIARPGSQMSDLSPVETRSLQRCHAYNSSSEPGLDHAQSSKPQMPWPTWRATGTTGPIHSLSGTGSPGRNGESDTATSTSQKEEDDADDNKGNDDKKINSDQADDGSSENGANDGLNQFDFCDDEESQSSKSDSAIFTPFSNVSINKDENDDAKSVNSTSSSSSGSSSDSSEDLPPHVHNENCRTEKPYFILHQIHCHPLSRWKRPLGTRLFTDPPALLDGHMTDSNGFSDVHAFLKDHAKEKFLFLVIRHHTCPCVIVKEKERGVIRPLYDNRPTDDICTQSQHLEELFRDISVYHPNPLGTFFAGLPRSRYCPPPPPPPGFPPPAPVMPPGRQGSPGTPGSHASPPASFQTVASACSRAEISWLDRPAATPMGPSDSEYSKIQPARQHLQRDGIYREQFLIDHVNELRDCVRSMANKKQTSQEEQDKIEAGKALLDYIESDASFTDELDGSHQMFSLGVVDATSIHHLFRENDIVVARYLEAGDIETHMAIVLTRPVTIPHQASSCGQQRYTNPINFSGWRWRFDGMKLERRAQTFDVRFPILEDEGPLMITDLPVYPLRFASNEVKDELRNAGEEFWSMFAGQKGPVHVSGEGWNMERTWKYPRDSRFMVDYETYVRSHPNSPWMGLAWTCPDGLSAWWDNYPITIPAAQEYLPDECAMLIYPEVIAFGLNSKLQWTRLHLDNIGSVGWDTYAFGRLSQHEHISPSKDIARRLVLGRAAKDRKNRAMGINSVGNDDGPLVLHFHGPPGTGKSAAAVALAEAAQLPLYRVRISDVPHIPLETRKFALSMIEVGLTWPDCALLIEGVDYWIDRTKGGGNRTHWHTDSVYQFVNLLENYPGIIFMTSTTDSVTSETNRLRGIDPAIRSKIQVSVAFDMFKYWGDTQEQVWRENLTKWTAEGKISKYNSEHVMRELRGGSWLARYVNGHEVNKVLKTAWQLAEYDDVFEDHDMTRVYDVEGNTAAIQTTFRWKHVKMALDAEFDGRGADSDVDSMGSYDDNRPDGEDD